MGAERRLSRRSMQGEARHACVATAAHALRRPYQASSLPCIPAPVWSLPWTNARTKLQHRHRGSQAVPAVSRGLGLLHRACRASWVHSSKML